MNRHALTLLKGLVAFLLLGAGWFIFMQYRQGALSAQELGARAKELGEWAPYAFVAGYALLAGLGFPALALSTLGGLLFGAWLGTALNIAGATAGASLAFLFSRFLLKNFFARRFGGAEWYLRFNAGIRANGFNYMLFVRLIPLFPFNGINFAAGLSQIRYREFLLGTVIGIAPHTFAFTNAVAEAGESAARGFTLTPGLALAVALLALFAIAPVVVKNVIERRRERNSGQAGPPA